VARNVSITEFARILGKTDEDMEGAMIVGLRSAAYRLSGIVVEEIDTASPHPAVDRGELRNSVTVRTVEDGATVTVESPHAAPMEYGTRPFRPPLEPIQRWALRKGLARNEEEARQMAFRIQSKFAKQGIEPRGYFAKAWQEMIRANVVEIEVSAELDELARRRGSS